MVVDRIIVTKKKKAVDLVDENTIGIVGILGEYEVRVVPLIEWY
jgi:hypothetical protein